MDYISDSDAENTLPLLPASAVDADMVREIVEYFSEETKSRLRAEAAPTLFHHIYEIPIDTAINANTTTAFDEAIDDQEQHPTGLEAAPATETPQVPTPPATSASYRSAANRSLRKRTFASRHPYIADQADWLGICSVDSINEMFDGDDDAEKVVRALNQIYLQKKKRYPDEDRYRSKDFYVHLGMSKSMAIQGDPEAQVVPALGDLAQSQELDYDPGAQESPSQQSVQEQEEQLIPFDIFDIPPDSHTEPTIEAEYSDSDSQNDSEPSDTATSSDEEQYIRIGGKYRKLSTILRGVLPESAKRLSQFHEAKPGKRRKVTSKIQQPRKGLGVKKFGAISSQSLDLARELREAAEESIPYRLKQPLIFENSKIRRDLTIFEEPALSRSLSSLGYRLDTPDTSVMTLSSGSEAEEDIEEIMPESLGVKSKLHLKSSHYDHQLASLPQLRYSKAPKSSRVYHALQPGKQQQSAFRSRPSIQKGTSLPRPASRKRNRTGNSSFRPARQPPITDFRQPSMLHPIKHRQLSASDNIKNRNHKKKAKDGKNHVKVWPDPESNRFKRQPVVDTSIFEIESTDFRNIHREIQQETPQTFFPTKALLFGDTSNHEINTLVGLQDTKIGKTLANGQIFFRGEDTVCIQLRAKLYNLSLISRQDSQKQLGRLLLSMKKTLANPQILLDLADVLAVQTALRMLIKWLLISREKPSEGTRTQMQLLLSEFLKIQSSILRKRQMIIHSQLLYIYWLLGILDSLHDSANQDSWITDIDSYATDFWISFLQTFSASDLSVSSANPPRRLEVIEAVALVHAIFSDQKAHWWHSITAALHEVIIINGNEKGILDTLSAISCFVKPSDYSWSPLLTVLSRFDASRNSNELKYFMSLCEVMIQRLDWPMEEKLVVQLFSVFAKAKFASGEDEVSIPSAIDVVRTAADIPNHTAFQVFMSFVYKYVSLVDSTRDVKRLVSKLLSSSQYQYVRGRSYQIMFANRINFLVLLSQISDVDLSNQLANAVEQVKTSSDCFVYGRALRALQVFTEVSRAKEKPVPMKVVTILFEAVSKCTEDSDTAKIFRQLLSFVSSTFQTPDEIVLFLQMMTDLNLLIISDVHVGELLGVLILLLYQLQLCQPELKASQLSDIDNFVKGCLTFLSRLMSQDDQIEKEHSQIYDNIQMAIQIWHMSCAIIKSQHWNVMYLQKFSYLGTMASRSRYEVFFCLEYYRTGVMSTFVIEEMDRILLMRLLDASISDHAADLHERLSKNQGSIFYSPPSHGTLNSIQPRKLSPTTRQQTFLSALKRLLLGSRHTSEKARLVSAFVCVFKSQLGDSKLTAGYEDFVKKVVSCIQTLARDDVKEMNDFWFLSANLGFPNKLIQGKWENADDYGKIAILNSEFLLSLSHGTNTEQALDIWVYQKDKTIIYSLIQLYLDAIPMFEGSWIQLSQLLEYFLLKLEKFQIEIKNPKFQKFFKLLQQMAARSDRRDKLPYILYELQALTISAKILKHAYFVYDGYKDQELIKNHIIDFMNVLDCPPTNLSTHEFSTISVADIRNGISILNNPQPEHTFENYTQAYESHQAYLRSLVILIQAPEATRELNQSIDYAFLM